MFLLVHPFLYRQFSQQIFHHGVGLRFERTRVVLNGVFFDGNWRTFSFYDYLVQLFWNGQQHDIPQIYQAVGVGERFLKNLQAHKRNFNKIGLGAQVFKLKTAAIERANQTHQRRIFGIKNHDRGRYQRLLSTVQNVSFNRYLGKRKVGNDN